MSFFVRLYLSGLLLLVIHCNCEPRHPVDEARVAEIANEGGRINNKLKPLVNGKLGDGTYGFVWQGTVESYIFQSIPVAIKFVAIEHAEHVDREYRMFEILGAIGNATVERYGIPAVYYRGIVLDKYDAVAMTLLGKSIFEKFHELKGKISPISVLLVFQKAIKILKYIHGRGVIHQDIKPENILLRGAEIFLIDFNLAIDEYETCDGGTPIFASINGHEGVRRTEMDDFESLFYTMLDFAGVKLPWDRDDVQQSEYHKYKKNAFQVRMSCRKVLPRILQRVFLDFYDQIMSGETIPKYDESYYEIDEIIESIKQTDEPAYFEWLTQEEIAHAKTHPTPPIEMIRGPSEHSKSEVDPLSAAVDTLSISK